MIRRRLFSCGLLLATILTLLPFHHSLAASGSVITPFTADGTAGKSFTPFPDLGGTAGSIFIGDLGADGISEILVGAGKGTQPAVRAFRQDGSKLFEFFAYGKNFLGGVNVTACDLNSDGKTEIITGTGYTGGPQIRIFDTLGQFTGMQFFAFANDLRGGVTVACGDVDGDGQNEIIAGSGLLSGNSIRIFSTDGNLKTELWSEDENVRGVNVSVGNIDADPEEEILASPITFGTAPLTIFDHGSTGFTKTTESAGFASATYGFTTTVFNKNIFVSSGPFLAPNTHLLRGEKTLTLKDPGNGYATLLAFVPESGAFFTLLSPSPLSPEASGQYIRVDLSEQRLTAYENGVEIKSFLISSGVRSHPTPTGKTTILAKIPVMTYAWSYGPDHPDNYNLPNVKWNLRFRNHFYIHSAYWHHNFGHPMSHGCVNMSVPDAEWVYNWANVGATVEVAQ